jgi:hypothetical protein
MEFWEFLLQKEGDRSWLPLESPQVEILEGKYRVVARSSRTNSPVEIRIIHDATTEIPPVRRAQKRQGKTNQEGLIVIMPFTRLLPGVWQLRCLSDLMADMMGTGWQYTLNINVLPIEPDIHDEWDSDWNNGITNAEGTGEEEQVSEDEVSVPVTSKPTNLNSGKLGETALEPTYSDSIHSNATHSNATPLADEASLNEVPLAVEPSAQPEPEHPEPEHPEPEHPEPEHPEPEHPEPEQLDQQTEPITAAGEASHLLPLAPRFTDLDEEIEDHDDRHHQPISNQPISNQSISNQSTSNQPNSDQANHDQANHDRSEVAPNLDQSVSHLPFTSPIRLNLGQETYVVQRGQAVTLMGQVESVDNLLTYELLPVETLEVRLYDPRTSRILVEKRQPLTARRLPFPFTCRITLPDHFQTYLVLGELILYGAADGDVPPPVLATQSFNVTTDLRELIESIANDYSDTPEADIPPPPEAPLSSEARSGGVSFSNATNPTETEIPFKASLQQPLPPQLYQPESERSTKPPELPTFAQASASEQPEIEPEEVQSGILRQTDEPNEQDIQPISEITDATFSDVNGDMPSEALTEDTPIAPVIQSFEDAPLSNWSKPDRHWETPPTQPIASVATSAMEDAEPASPEQAAFRALNLQNRFWERLQALIADRELAQWLSEVQAEELDQSQDNGAFGNIHSNPTNHSTDHSTDFDPNIQTENEITDAEAFPLSRIKRRSIGKDAALTAHEVMAEDEWESDSSSEKTSDSDITPATLNLVLPIDEPIPIPQLNIQDGDLKAGQTLAITVKIPDLRPRIFVKLWLSERQSRSILTEPQWLKHFAPDGFGNLFQRTEVTVPHGCVEIQIEAIAVEMVTQRESDKAAIVRQVEPADLSSYSLDEFEI